MIEDLDKDRIPNLEQAGQLEGEDEEAFAMRIMRARMAGPSAEALAAIKHHEVVYDDEDKQDACTRNPQLKLLLRLIKWEHRESDERTHLIWTIPAALAPTDLLGYIRIVDQYLLEPFMPPEEDKALDDMVRKEYKRKPRRLRSESPASGAEGKADASDDDAALFSDPEVAAAIRGSRTKLKKASSGKKGKGKAKHEGGAEDDDKAIRRRKKRAEEAKKYRTAEFIVDSDDDEEADRLFFKQEEALRQEMEARAGKNRLAEDGEKADKHAAQGKEAKATTKAKKVRKPRKSRDKGRATSATQLSNLDMANGDSDAHVWSSASEAEDAAPSRTKAKSPEARPRPVPTVKPANLSRADSELEVDDDAEASSSSPEMGNSSAVPLKRARPLTSDAEIDIDGSSPKMSAAAAARKGRLVVDSDEE